MNAPLPAPPVAPAAMLNPSNEALLRKLNSGASWLWWVAGFSVVNTILIVFEAPFQFAIGLGFTMLLGAIGNELGGPANVVALALSALVWAGLFLLGWLGRKQQSWALWLGLIALAADTVLLLALAGFAALISIAIHAYAIVCVWWAISALRTYQQRAAQGLT